MREARCGGMAQGHETQDVRHKTVARCTRSGMWRNGAGFYRAAAGDCGPPKPKVRSGGVAKTPRLRVSACFVFTGRRPYPLPRQRCESIVWRSLKPSVPPCLRVLRVNRPEAPRRDWEDRDPPLATKCEAGVWRDDARTQDSRHKTGAIHARSGWWRENQSVSDKYICSPSPNPFPSSPTLL